MQRVVSSEAPAWLVRSVVCATLRASGRQQSFQLSELAERICSMQPYNRPHGSRLPSLLRSGCDDVELPSCCPPCAPLARRIFGSHPPPGGGTRANVAETHDPQGIPL